MSFLILIAIVAILPIMVNDIPIFFMQGVSLAVFLAFGLLAEMLFMQIAIIIMFAKIRLRRQELFRLPMNLIMFLLISLLSGLFYYALGGNHADPTLATPSYLIPIIGYILITFVINQVFILAIRRFIYKDNELKVITQDAVWDAISSLLIYPVGLVLYMLYTDLGYVAILFVGIPLISISLILQLFYKSKKMNDYLQEVSEFGHHLAERLQVDDVLNLFIEKLTKMLHVDYVFILEVSDNNELRLIKSMEKPEQPAKTCEYYKKNEGISGQVFANGRAILYQTKKQWRDLENSLLPNCVESILCVPVTRNQQVTGIIYIASNKKGAFEKSYLMLVDIMISYFAVSLENARHYEKTKHNSERCPLTNLYNYRYFEGLLEQEFKKLKKTEGNQNLSLMLLDLDHFKLINDRYGHQSGNEVLCEVARRIISVIGIKGTVARYGGEEFVVLLPNVNRSECLRLAEEVRKGIANKPFIIHHNLENIRRKMMVRVTTSIGVATAPIDADDSYTLVRHADRAMYNGAKQSGRNKVAAYVK